MRVFSFASWLSVAAGEGCRETAEVAVPALLPRCGAVAPGVAILDIVADDSSWARFYLAEPGFRHAEVAFKTEDGEEGLATARLVHDSDARSRQQEGADDCWFMSLWAGPLWCGGPIPASAVLDDKAYCDTLRAIPQLAQAPLPGTKLVRCDGCQRDFASSHAWRCHVEEHPDGTGGCPASMFFPTEVAAERPAPFAVPAGLAGTALPAPGLLRRLLVAARSQSQALLCAVLDESLLLDGRTPLRQYLGARPSLASFVLPPHDGGKAAVHGGQALCRWELCPLLRSGPLAIYRGSEARPHAIRRALLQQGMHHTEVEEAFRQGCGTLDAALECIDQRRRALWFAPPRCPLHDEPLSRVCVVFDLRLDEHFCDWPASKPGAKVMRLEGPQRTHAALEQFSRSGLLRRCRLMPCTRAATEAELLAVHVKAHVDLLLAAPGDGPGPSLGTTGTAATSGSPCPDFYMNSNTTSVALLCAGAHAEVASSVATGAWDAAVCVTRPPGHHAGGPSGYFSGGCFINNVALAVAAARATRSVKRILVLDWDVHHGDGSQEIFYGDPNTLTISIHRFEHEPGGFYPSAGLPTHCGHGEASGMNVNVAFLYAEGGYGDADYGAVFEHLVIPIARAYAPELVIVAAGFDSSRGDPLGGFDLTPGGYSSMLAQLQQLPSLCGRGLIVSLEGGYNPTATAAGLEACLRTLLLPPEARQQKAAELLHSASVKRETALSLAAALRCQARHWPCLTGWEEHVVASVRLGDLLYPAALECGSHSPCWCGGTSSGLGENGGDLGFRDLACRVALRCVCSDGTNGACRNPSVTCTPMAQVWGGLGLVVEVLVEPSSAGASRVVVKLTPTAPGVMVAGDVAKRDAYAQEATFYERGHADELRRAGAECPRSLLVDRGAGGGAALALCLSRLEGARPVGGLSPVQVLAALEWLARLHALYWGPRAERAVCQGSLHPQGCFWALDRRPQEHQQMPTSGWEGRLRLAARAVDARLKADRCQTICHGDAKAENMLFRASGGSLSVAFVDFEYAGRAQPTKDVAYCLLCTEHALSEAEQQAYLQRYLELLRPLLQAQGDEAPALAELQAAYALSLCDLARFMSGWGWRGQEPVMRERCAGALSALDGGCPLSSEEDYMEAVFRVFQV